MGETPVRFDDFELDRDACELRRAGAPVRLQRIPLELLFLLVEQPGRLVTRDEIMERVWGKGVFVDSENSINTAIRKIRRALGDDSGAPRFVATVPARGYRFIAEIRPSDLIRAGQNRVPAAATMVGRAPELSALLDGLDDMVRGRGRIFLISGEPGIGKTHLADQTAAAADARGMAILAGHCSEDDEAVAYLPFVEILENFFDRFPDTDRIRSLLGDDAPQLARLVPRLNTLARDLPPALKLTPSQARRHLFNSFFNFAARVTAEQPVLMLLEDLHWADDSTLSLLDFLSQRVATMPLSIIVTYRDGGLKQAPGLARTLESLIRGHSAVRIALKRLSRAEVAAMIHGLSEQAPPPEIVDLIFAETQGNPFFVEELLRHLEEENRLYDSSGRFRTDFRLAENDAPPGVRLVVGRRLARLSEPARQILSTAATIGRVFSFDLLRSVCRVDADPLLERIEESERAGLVLSCEDTINARFEFSHELIRQAVIADLSVVRRQRLHLDVADAIERSGGDSDSTAARRRYNHPADLANRYARGGNLIKAVQYGVRAVRQLANVGSNAEALAQFKSALELLEQVPDDDQRTRLELDIRIAASGLLGDTMGFASPETERSLLRAMELGQRSGVPWKKTWLTLYGILFVYLTRPNVPKSCEIAAKLLALSEQQNSIDHVADANTWLACARMYSGDFQDADRLFERGWSLLESSVKPADAPTPHRVGQLLQGRELLWQEGTPQNNRGLSALNLWFLGYPDRAIERIAIATEIAHSGVKTMLADVHGFAAYLFDLLRDPERMKASAQARLALAVESGYTAGRALSEFFLGYADALTVEPTDGLARMERHLYQLRAIGFETGAGYYLALIAMVLGRIARYDEALRTIDESLSAIEQSGQRHYEAEVHRLRGELILGRNRASTAPAEQSFRAAIEIARRQRAKSWELRATTSLARLLHRTGRDDEARETLAGIYGWFTEGSDTADLREANQLLRTLGA